MKKFGEEVLAVLQRVQVGKIPLIKKTYSAWLRSKQSNPFMYIVLGSKVDGKPL
jgi:hypothetical protein